jgi:prefoldin subunit 5
MSHWTCEHCGGRFRDEHTCDQDPENMAAEIASLRAEVSELRAELEELRGKVAEEIASLEVRLPW